ncbi:MAG: hypothetical protein IPP83_11205 [Flavobacteriales bacterium]|nr:hypothetical protein [Flavobacteriales bacterium]
MSRFAVWWEINRVVRDRPALAQGSDDLMERYGEAEVQRLLAAMAARHGTPVPKSIGPAYWSMEFEAAEEEEEHRGVSNWTARKTAMR